LNRKSKRPVPNKALKIKYIQKSGTGGTGNKNDLFQYKELKIKHMQLFGTGNSNFRET
jgi:hypothetical protein